MIFGIDFDNTIVNYDSVFKKIAKKEKTLKNKKFNTKDSIKNFLIKENKVNEWKKLQGQVYSEHIYAAIPNIEILKLLKYLDSNNIKFYIVSHKTLYPYVGKKINLHRLSKKWLKENIFNKKNNFKKKDHAYFEKTKKEKIKRIKKMKITHFVDDLDVILNKLPKEIFGIKYKNSFKFNIIKKNLLMHL